METFRLLQTTERTGLTPTTPAINCNVICVGYSLDAKRRYAFYASLTLRRYIRAYAHTRHVYILCVQVRERERMYYVSFRSTVFSFKSLTFKWPFYLPLFLYFCHNLILQKSSINVAVAWIRTLVLCCLITVPSSVSHKQSQSFLNWAILGLFFIFSSFQQLTVNLLIKKLCQ